MIRAALVAALVALAALSLGGVACGGKQEMTAPPPPLRPEAEATNKVAVQKDCEPLRTEDQLKPLAFDERSIPEGQRLADQGKGRLRASQSAEVTRASQQDMLTQAVDDFITALRADPYNVEATYSLAAAYVIIGRHQCTINLLSRLLEMRPHPSKQASVNAHLDRLLGRKQALDPDFAEIRKDTRFRELIQKMCADTNDANCVYGAQRDNRER